jgi:hypothetical protein
MGWDANASQEKFMRLVWGLAFVIISMSLIGFFIRLTQYKHIGYGLPSANQARCVLSRIMEADRATTAAIFGPLTKTNLKTSQCNKRGACSRRMLR